jgi:hypothetical protein
MCVMKRAAVLACAATVLVIPTALASRASSHPLLPGLAFRHGVYYLVWLDPLTLRQVGSRSLRLPSFGAWDRSPDGSRFVFINDQGGLRFVNPARMRATGTVKPSGFVQPEVAWVAPRTVLVFDNEYVAAVDPVTLRVRWRRRFPDSVSPFLFEAEARSPLGLVFLVPPADGSVGVTTVVSVDLSGHIRSVILSQIQSGAAQDPSGASLFTGSEPGFAVDPQAEQAYVVGGDGTVADIDLASMAVSYPYHPRTLAHTEKILSGPTRQAIWLGNGLLAITGSNGHAWLDAKHNYQETSTPAGLTILDTHTWTTRVIDSGTSTVTFANGLLLASGEQWDTTTNPSASTPVGNGLSAYTVTGSKVFHVLGTTPVPSTLAVNGLAYVWQYPPSGKGNVTATVIDLTTGSVLRTISQRQSAPSPLIAFP